jgi:hypothetical protein
MRLIIFLSTIIKIKIKIKFPTDTKKKTLCRYFSIYD